MDMKPSTKTRVQRRVEKKQVTLLVALVVVIAMVSFALGVVVGRYSTKPMAIENNGESRRIQVAETPRVESVPYATKVQPKPVQDKLSFYENLSKEDPAPIGSGINLPPDKGLPAAEGSGAQRRAANTGESAGKVSATTAEKNPDAVKGAVVQTSPSVKGTSAVVSRPPVVSTDGDWVVQVFSSRSAADAGMLRDNLSSKGYSAFIAEADLGKKGIWYRVLLGPFAEKEIANQIQVKANKKDKLSGFVKRR